MATSGSTTVDFGTSGEMTATKAITGQTAIISTSVVDAWIMATASTDHTADEHVVEDMTVMAGNVVAGTGFTIYAHSLSIPLRGVWTVGWAWA